jgi:peptide methionine sulfoxide reductase msrA/msrB
MAYTISLKSQEQPERRNAMSKYVAGFTILTAIFAIFVGLSIWHQPSHADNSAQENKDMKYNKLTPEEEYVIINKGTERPFSGEYVNYKESGVYVCKRCDAPLFRSDDKFDSHCGWPSFDDEIEGAIKRSVDADGHRTEITCANCGAHLGHVFEGEGFTPKNIRHCVNSISLNFVSSDSIKTWPGVADNKTTEKAYFAGGCFWGVEYMLESLDGVIDARSGYMGGNVENPSYKQVSYENTGHAETVEVEYDPAKISFEELAKYFFEIHDPTQQDRQGPDIGHQYRSAVFYVSEDQKITTEKLVNILKNKGYNVVTEVIRAEKFYPAEDYHQDYYEGNGKTPYCHVYQKRF